MVQWPTSAVIERRLAEKIPGAAHYNFRFFWREPPITFVRGHGQRLVDVDGNEFLDLFSGFGATILGHGHAAYVHAVQQAAAQLATVPHTLADETIADRLLALLPGSEMVRFCVTGTEAVQLTLRLARAHTGRNRFIRFSGHYHGHSDNVLGGRPRSADDPVPVDFDADPRGTAGRARGALETQSFLLPWNDLAAVRQVFSQHGAHIAAVITEPICLSTVGVWPEPGYLEGLRSLCEVHGALLIFDEVLTGFRVALGGAQSLVGVTPDLAIFGKAMGGGLLPVSVVVGRRAVMEQLGSQRVAHGGTFNGYPLGMAATAACLDVLSGENRPLARMHARGEQMMTILRSLARETGISSSVQGHAGCFYYHCADEPVRTIADWTPAIQQRGAALRALLFEEGILTAPLGRFFPSIAISDEDVAEFERRARRALERLPQE